MGRGIGPSHGRGLPRSPQSMPQETGHAGGSLACPGRSADGTEHNMTFASPAVSVSMLLMSPRKMRHSMITPPAPPRQRSSKSLAPPPPPPPPPLLSPPPPPPPPPSPPPPRPRAPPEILPPPPPPPSFSFRWHRNRAPVPETHLTHVFCFLSLLLLSIPVNRTVQRGLPAP